MPASRPNSRPTRTLSPARSKRSAIGVRPARRPDARQPSCAFSTKATAAAPCCGPPWSACATRRRPASIDRLYVHSPDRLARKYAYQVLLLDELRRRGVEVVFLNRDIGRSPEDDLLLQVQGMVAEYERAKILERSRRGKLHAARGGSVNVWGGSVRLSLCRQAEGGGEASLRDSSRNRRAVVRQIFAWVGRGRCSIGEVCRRLQQQGVPSPKGKTSWDRTTVWGMLRNPAYVRARPTSARPGSANARPRLRPPAGAARAAASALLDLTRLPAADQVVIAVPATGGRPALFAAVAEQLAENRNASGSQASAGPVTCCKVWWSASAAAMRSTASRSAGRLGQGHRALRLLSLHRHGCLSLWGPADLPQRAVRTDVLERPCGTMCVPCWPTRSDSARSMNAGAERPTGEEKAEVARLQSRIQTAKRGIARLIDGYEEGLLDKSEFEPRIRRAKERLGKLEGERADADEAGDGGAELQRSIGHLHGFAERVQEGFARGGLGNAAWRFFGPWSSGSRSDGGGAHRLQGGPPPFC